MPLCKGCGREFEKGELSHRGLCLQCAANRMRESVRQMQEHKGPIYEVYKSRHAVAMQRRRKQKA